MAEGAEAPVQAGVWTIIRELFLKAVSICVRHRFFRGSQLSLTGRLVQCPPMVRSEAEIGAELDTLSSDPEALGTVLGFGTQHKVYRRGDEVLKLPHDQVPGFRDTMKGWLHSTLVSPFVRQTPQVAKRNAQWAKEYFEHFMASSDVIAGVRSQTYYVLQRFVASTRLTPESVQSDPSLKEQLREIMNRNRDLMKEKGHLLDAMGCAIGPLVRLFSKGEGTSDNIVVGQDRKLTIIDDGMFPLPDRGGVPGHSHALQYIQELNMRSFLGRPDKDHAGWYYLDRGPF